MNRSPPNQDLLQLNNNLLVFFYDRQTGIFDTSRYYPALTDDKISLEELNGFLDYVAGMISKKRRGSHGKLDPRLMMFICLLIILGLALILAIVFYVDAATNGSSSSTTVNISGYGFFVTIIVIAFIIAFGCAVKIYYNMHRASKIRKNVEGFIYNQQPNFDNRGLRWNVPIQFPKWIELWKLDPPPAAQRLPYQEVNLNVESNTNNHPEDLDETMIHNKSNVEMLPYKNYNDGKYNERDDYRPSNIEIAGYRSSTPEIAGYRSQTPEIAGYRSATPEIAGYRSTRDANRDASQYRHNVEISPYRYRERDNRVQNNMDVLT